MFSELPKLIGREFAIGYFLPTAAFVAAVSFVLAEFGYGADLADILQSDLLIGGTAVIVLTWLLSLTLMALNRLIIRILEGYGLLNPFRLVRFIQLRTFKRLHTDTRGLAARAKAEQGTPTSTLETEHQRGRLQAELAKSFPSREGLILPTAFGNTIRAFEDYSRVVYGFDSIEGWDRLVSVVPSEYRKIVDSAKTKVDFAANLWFGALLLAFIYATLAITHKCLPALWHPVLCLGVAWLIARSARASAYEWGVTIKTAIDVYLPELAKKMGYELPRNAAKRRKFWILFSQQIIYREPEAYADLDKFRVMEMLARRTGHRRKRSTRATNRR